MVFRGYCSGANEQVEAITFLGVPPRGDDDQQIRARQSVAGRFGFVLGCVAAVAAAAINLWRAPRPFTVASVALAVLMAALNVPFGIALGLLGERLTRPRE